MNRINTIDWSGVRKSGFNLFTKLIRTKNPRDLECAQEVPLPGKQRLSRCLSTLDLTSLGVGSCVGTGMYLVAGMVAHKYAGPAVILSFVIAAVASIFSGACYAEFGVRVPHTTGSAYMYTYVTVGEFIAFIIGWNMVLEYVIGTSACARALSACIDSLLNGAISNFIEANVGTIFGKPPDFLALAITLLMMMVLLSGVKKSLFFTNIMNGINLSVWVFIMGSGFFYADTDNWTNHGGFMPNGWTGVFSGAATCFYAFIGFDIIATTGEEATNPKRSIPFAIVFSLVIILSAYVSSSMMLTLMVPYDQVDMNSALVAMFDRVHAPVCKFIVSIGALAGLTASMFGSMFPMPRVVYAMAQDGLMFRSLSRVSETTGTPAVATMVGGVAAAIVAFVFQLELLVEMMSIGTLLAYTLVASCVLVLRYQQGSTNLIELLPQSLRTPVVDDPQLEAGERETAFVTGFPELSNNQTRILPANQRVMVRRVTRSSPDSDDTLPGDDSEEFGRDDSFLVSDRTENKFYGTVAGGSSSNSGSTCTQFFNAICRKLQVFSYICPGICPWVDSGPATYSSGVFVVKCVGILYALIIIFDLFAAYGSPGEYTFTNTMMTLLLIGIVILLLLISRKPQNRTNLIYVTPALPIVPVIAITVNIYLILNLSYMTLIRFVSWMIMGFILYFHYGIKNSTLELAPPADDNDDQRPPAITASAMDRALVPAAPPRQEPSPHRNIFEGDGCNYNYNLELYAEDGVPDPLLAWDRAEPSSTPAVLNTTTTYKQIEQRYDMKSNMITSHATTTQPSMSYAPPPRPPPTRPPTSRPPWAEKHIPFPSWDD